MDKKDKRGQMKQLFANPAIIKIAAAILVAIIVVVGIFAVVASSSKDAERQVVSVEQKADEKVQEKQDADEPAEETQEVAQEEAVIEETAEEVEYAAVFVVTINPKLKIFVDWDNVVVKMETMNADAETLLTDFNWENQKLEDCFESLLSEAHEKGFLKDNAKVSIEVEESKEVDTSSLIQKMENAAQVVCTEKAINIKWIANDGNVEESMNKEITGKRANTILPTNKEQTETVAEAVTQDKPQDDRKPESESGSSNSGNNNGSNSGSNGGNSGSTIPDTPVVPDEPVEEDEYSLVWEDNFDGTELNRNDWNVELHEKGWVNEEWQEYVDEEENIYLKDGKLILQAIKTTKNGEDYYTSGRVNTQNKHDFKYGKFEARIKVPSGMGFLPAFWMMPTDEQYYGQWPKCGEIDIMEVMGQSTDTLHGTIHYGDPHGQKQGTYVLDDSKADFAEEFHVYSCEWEPGRITWYVDGVKFHEAIDWYTKREGFDEVAYPAPFDQPFYMILNVAVGGSWVGYPDETTQFGDNAQMQVDYVRVYQKDSYDENVEKPEKAEVPDSAIGENLLTNGDFANAESMKDEKDWEFLTANGGVGDAQVVSVNGDNVLKITTENAGTVDYSIQIVQGPIALKQGNKYKVSFDAWADEERSMKALISAPDLNYIRYWGDQTVNLTTEKQTFTYEFDMEEAGDANSRFEMTFGAMNSIATVYIDNVKVEKTDSFEVAEDVKTVLPDGNYVYNSGFDTGSDRMKYWTVDSNISDVSYLATNADGVREFKAVVPNTVSLLEDVVLKQEDTAISGGKTYLFTFDAYGAEAKTIKAVVAPKSTLGDVEDLVFDVNVTTTKTGYEFTFTMPEGVTGSDVKFLIGAAGTTYIDNVRVQEDANVINGNFTSGVAGWNLYVNSPAEANFAIDELDNGSGTPAAAINITNNGTQDWHIQFRQNVTLEQGKRYRISFDAWSPSGRKFVFAIQRNADKKGGGEWTSYSGDINEALSTEGFKHYSKEFNMTWETDDIAEIKFTLGKVGGEIIDTPHTVFIDNVVLEELGPCEESEIPEVEAGVNMFTNSSFESGELNPWILNIYGGAEATSTVNNEAATIDIKNVGPEDGAIALQYKNLVLETGASYVLTFDAVSTETRAIKPCFMDPDKGYAWYGGTEVELEKDAVKSVEFPFTVSAVSSNSVMFQVGMGKLGDSTALSKITLSNFKLIKVGASQPEAAQPVNVTLSDICLVKIKNANGNTVEDGSNLAVGEWIGADTIENGKLKKTVNDPGEFQYSVQLQQLGINLEANCEYKLTFKGSADAEKLIQVGLQENGNDWTVYSLIDGQNIGAKLGTEEKSFTIVFTMDEVSDNNTTFFFNLGNVTTQNAGTIISADGEEQETPGEGGETEEPEEGIEGNMVEHGDFTLSDSFNEEALWQLWPGYAGENSGAVANVQLSGGNAKFDITGLGSNPWDIQLEYKKLLKLEQGCTYKVKYDAISTEARKIKAQLGNGTAEIYFGKDVNLEKDVLKTVEYEFLFDKATNSEMQFVFQLGKFDETTPLSTVTIDNISIVKIGSNESGNTPSNPGVPADNMFTCGDFADATPWSYWYGYAAGDDSTAKASTAYDNEQFTVQVESVGEYDYSVQLKYDPKLTLENGVTYKLSFDVTSSKARNIVTQFQNSSYVTYGYEKFELAEKEKANVEMTFKVEKETSSDISYYVNIGKIDGSDTIGKHTIVFDNFCLVKVPDASAQALMMLRRPATDVLVEEETEETVEETTSVEESTEEVTTEEESADETSSEEESSEETTTESEATKEQTTEEATTEEESIEETTTEDETTSEEESEEEDSEEPSQEPSGEDAIVEIKSEEEEEVEE